MARALCFTGGPSRGAQIVICYSAFCFIWIATAAVFAALADLNQIHTYYQRRDCCRLLLLIDVNYENTSDKINDSSVSDNAKSVWYFTKTTHTDTKSPMTLIHIVDKSRSAVVVGVGFWCLIDTDHTTQPDWSEHSPNRRVNALCHRVDCHFYSFKLASTHKHTLAWTQGVALRTLKPDSLANEMLTTMLVGTFSWPGFVCPNWG